jgi:hypothetical protein
MARRGYHETLAILRSWWMMTVPTRNYLVKGIVTAAFTSPGLLRGKIPDLGLPDQMMVMCGPVLPHGYHFWSRRWLEVSLRWSGMSLPA